MRLSRCCEVENAENVGKRKNMESDCSNKQLAGALEVTKPLKAFYRYKRIGATLT